MVNQTYELRGRNHTKLFLGIYTRRFKLSFNSKRPFD